MTDMTGAGWATVASTTIAAGAAAIAVWQAKTAKTSALAAKAQAEAVERQAAASEAQVELMQQQVAQQELARNLADGPTFEILEVHHEWDSERFATARLSMTTGPPLEEVVVTARGDDVRFLAPYVGSHDRLEKLEWKHVSRGEPKRSYCSLNMRR